MTKKDDRVIHSGITLDDGTVLGPGQEDELEEALTPEQVECLTNEGALSGAWSGKRAATDEEKERSAAAKPRRAPARKK